jgi:type IV pilus assembly protein PilB
MSSMDKPDSSKASPRPGDSAGVRLLTKELAKGVDLSVITFVDALIECAHALRSSDVHLDPRDDGLAIRFRVDGVLQHIGALPAKAHLEVISRLKILCGLRTDEHQAAQDGRFKVSLTDGVTIDVRTSIVPTYYGENAVLRLLSDQAEEFTLDSLGFTPENRAKIERAIHKPHGMILATGPTGSGKTTTLYTLVKMLNVPETSILTIEDPIEYSVAGVNQIQVNQRTGLTFANGLRSMLRQDPNVIMVGEIRDTDTAGLAVNTALTGHLVLSTLHTNDAPTTLPRLLDMKVEPYLIASTVNIAIGQRLVRKICQHCKTEKPVSDTERKSFSEIMPAELVATQTMFYFGAGCDRCGGSGYSGRVGLHEVMVMDGPVRDAVLSKVSANEIRRIALAQGMKSLVADGFYKAAKGMTTIEEVLRMSHE